MLDASHALGGVDASPSNEHGVLENGRDEALVELLGMKGTIVRVAQPDR